MRMCIDRTEFLHSLVSQFSKLTNDNIKSPTSNPRYRIPAHTIQSDTMMFLTHMQHLPRNIPSMTITPLKNPGDDIVDRRPDLTEECQMFMKQTDECLKALGKECGNVHLHMGKLGLTTFRLHKFTIVVEVPRRDTYLRVYTLLHRTKPSDSPQMRMNLMKAALELNYLQLKTFGACLSLDPCPHDAQELEFTLSYNHNLIGLDPNEFVMLMMNFMQTTKEMYTTMMKKVNLPINMDRYTAADFDKVPPKPKRKLYVAYPKNHPRDLRVLYDEDVEGKVKAKKEKKKRDTQKRVAFQEDTKKAIVVPKGYNGR